VLTQKELAAKLGVSDRTVRNWVAAGCPVVGSGRSACHDEGAVRAWLHRTGRDRAKIAPVAPAAPESDAQPESLGGPVKAMENAVVAAARSAKLSPPPSAADERRMALDARGRSWLCAELAIRRVQERLEGDEIDPSPAQAEALARAARTLSEAVRGDASEGTRRTLRDSLVAGMRQWAKQWGRPALDELVREATA
jgi:hypothetical protein